MFTREFWLGDNGALTRAVRTFAQTAAAMIGVATFSPLDVGQWQQVAVTSATAALLSLLMSVDRRESFLAIPPTPAPATPGPQSTLDYSQWQANPPVYGCGDSLR